MNNHISDVDCKAGSHVGSTDFCLTQAEGGTILTVSFPSDRTARTEYGGTAHTAEFEEG
jgi:hypothetical protein